MNQGDDRGSLEGPPESMMPQVTPRESAAPPPPPPPGAKPAGTGSAAGSGFDFNQPTIISLLYISSFILGVTALVGVVLAFVWKSDAKEEWEKSHYEYLINTFWIGLIGSIVGFILLIVLIGFFILLATAVLVVVRSVLSLINAQKREPMPNPGTWLA